MYYLVEEYSDYDSVEFKVVEFSGSRESLEEKAKCLNNECEKLQNIYDNLEKLIDAFNETVDFFKRKLKLNIEDALNRALTVTSFPEDLKQYTQISDGKMTSCGLMSNYPTYYVDQIKEPDIKL